MTQTFEYFRDKTIEDIKQNKQLNAESVRSLFNDKSHDEKASKQWLEKRERLKTDAEFLTFFKQHFGEEL